MIPFWRTDPLTKEELELLDAVFAAHDKSSSRDNASSHIFVQTAIASGSYPNAVAAAALTIGGLHAPIEKTIHLLNHESPHGEALRILSLGGKVPGWGNSFEKGHPDELWVEVDRILRDKFGGIYQRIQSVTDALRGAGKDIHPNPSCYTAATVVALGMQDWMGSYIFIASRLTGWCRLILPNKGDT